MSGESGNMATGNHLPIRRLTLYKHGVGVVEREGSFAGEEAVMTLRAAEVNDALKSLLVRDRRGGQVLGVRYDTPIDRQTRLAETPISLSPDHSLLDLLRALRGQAVRLVAGEGAQAEELDGRLLGIDLPVNEAPAAQTIVSALDEVTGTVTALPLHLVRRVVLLDERGAQDLRFFLDGSRSDETQRDIAVRLSPGDHELTVSYLVPAPTWRVSYRLVAESAPAAASQAAGAADEARDGELLLQGWGLFDNRLEEDLDAVDVTLVAGQPISFVYDLAASRVPARPVVQDAARIATGPVEFDAMLAQSLQPGAAEPEGLVTAAPMPMAAPAAARARQPAGRASRVSIEEIARQATAATGGDLGELFEYHVTAPVTVRRGASAMAPILQARLPYRRELLFNERKLPTHPVAALRFANDTGLVLERGPVTVYEDGAYRGEAMIPFVREATGVYLAFAVELGMRVTTATAHGVETIAIGIAGALLHVKQATVIRTTYQVASSLAESRTLTVEHPITANFELTATRPPDARGADVYRWDVVCPPWALTSFMVEERRHTWQAQHLLDQSYATLQGYLDGKWLDSATMARITPILEARSTMARNEQQIAVLLAEREEIYARQEQLRKTMGALGATGDEGALRARAVGQLRASEDRLDAIDAAVAALKDENARLQAAIDAGLATLRAGTLPGDADAI